MTSGNFPGASLLSMLATLVLAVFFVGGLLLLFANNPPNDLFPGIQMAAFHAIGGAAALFGMFGLLFARGLAVLIEIERSVRAASAGSSADRPEADNPSSAYKFGQAIGKAIHEGE